MKKIQQNRGATNSLIEFILNNLICIFILFLFVNPHETRGQVSSTNKSLNNSNWYIMPSVGVPFARYLPIDGLEEDEHKVRRSFLSEIEFGYEVNKNPKFTFEAGISFQLINHKLEGTYEGTKIDPDSEITANFLGTLINLGAGLKMTTKSVLLVRANIGNAFLFWNEEGLPKEVINVFPYGDFDLVCDIELKNSIKLRVGASVIPPFSNYYALTPFAGLKFKL